MAVGLLASPAAGTELQSSYVCIDDVEEPPVQTFVVPQGVSELQITIQGAHGGNPDNGGTGGYGGLVQAAFAVGPQGPLTPGQLLDVWVGCYGDNPVGWGVGGDKGIANSSIAHDGATGGAGSGVLDHATGNELVVAGGGGGGGGNGFWGGGGFGGDGGPAPQPGFKGASFGAGDGGCAACLGPGEINGGPGGASSMLHAGGGGGGGGGGHIAGGGGEGAGSGGGGGGGGGAGSSYMDPSANLGTQGTSQLAQDGLVLFDWGGDLRDRDGDGIPRSFDRCRSSETSKTVIVGRCDSRAGNDLDVDGCTITDRIVRIAKRTDKRSEFLQRVRLLGRALYENDFVTRPERRAIQRCAASVNFAKLRR